MAFVGGLLFVMFGFIMGCEVVQPLIDNAGAVEPAEPIKEVEEYFLVKPGIGLEYRTIDMNEPIKINLTDSTDQIEEMYGSSDRDYKSDSGGVILIIEREDIGTLYVSNLFDYNYFSVSKQEWKVPSGLGIGNTRKEIEDHYGLPVQYGYNKITYFYSNVNFSFDVNGIDRPNDLVESISISGK